MSLNQISELLTDKNSILNMQLETMQQAIDIHGQELAKLSGDRFKSVKDTQNNLQKEYAETIKVMTKVKIELFKIAEQVAVKEMQSDPAGFIK